MFTYKIITNVLLIFLSWFLIVNGLEDGFQQEEEEKGPLVSLLKSSADRVIANAPIIINRESELYQRYWKQRLPRRASIKANVPESEIKLAENENEVLNESLDELISDPQFLPLVQESEDVNIDNNDNQALPSIIEETVVTNEEEINQNQVSLSHDEPGTSLEQQLVQLEIEEEEANENNFLPSGDLLKLPDDSRDASSLREASKNSLNILERSKDPANPHVKEFRKVRLHPPTVVRSLPTRPTVLQLDGQFVHAERHRSLPASRFESKYFDQPQELDDENQESKSADKREITPAAASLRPTADLSTKTVYSTNSINSQETLFRYQVEKVPFESSSSTSSHIPQPHETIVTPPTTTSPTIFITDSPQVFIQSQNVDSQVFNGFVAAPPTQPEPVLPTSRPFEPVFQPDPQVFQPDPQVFQPDPQVFQADPQVFQPDPQVFQADQQVFQPDPQVFQADTQEFQAPHDSVKQNLNIQPSSPVALSQFTVSEQYNAVASPNDQYNFPKQPPVQIHFNAPEPPVKPPQFSAPQPTHSPYQPPQPQRPPSQNFGGYPQQPHQVELTTPHPLIYGFQPLSASKQPYSGTRQHLPPPPVPAAPSGGLRNPFQGLGTKTLFNSRPIRFPSFFF